MFHGKLNVFPVSLNCIYHGNDPLHSHSLCIPAVLTLILLTWRIRWAPNNASRWQMGFNLAFKGLMDKMTKTYCSGRNSYVKHYEFPTSHKFSTTQNNDNFTANYSQVYKDDANPGPCVRISSLISKDLTTGKQCWITADSLIFPSFEPSNLIWVSPSLLFNWHQGLLPRRKGVNEAKLFTSVTSVCWRSYEPTRLHGAHSNNCSVNLQSKYFCYISFVTRKTIFNTQNLYEISSATVRIVIVIYFLWRCGPTRAMASTFLRFLDHTQRRNTVAKTPLYEWSARRRDLYLTTHNTHNRQTSMPPVGFEPTISEGERPQTYALDRAATGTGVRSVTQSCTPPGRTVCLLMAKCLAASDRFNN